MKIQTAYLSTFIVGLLTCQAIAAPGLRAAIPALPQIKNLTADGHLQEYCRSVRINTIVVPDFCSLLARAETLYNKGNLQGAVLNYDQALQINPGYALAYYNRGVCRYRLGDTTGGIADLSRAKDLLFAQGDQQNYESSLMMLKQMQQG